MSSLCGETLSTCPSHDVTRDLSGDGYNLVTHTKSRDFTIVVGGITIPVQLRKRTFSIGYDETWSWAGLTIVVGLDGNAEDCGTKTGSGSAAISENAEFTDSEFFYLDHINGIAIWRERRETCIFAQTASKTAVFKVPYGSFYANWFEISPVIERVTDYCLLINGVKEIVETVTDQVILNPLNILWPLPPSLATPGDPCPAVFYDYNGGGVGGDMELAELDGGKDFYYPSWLRGMGLDRTIDQLEASERFTNYFMNHSSSDDLPPTQAFALPKLGYALPWGNAAKDKEGNILVSFKTANKTINRLYLADEDKTVIDLNTTGILEGDNLKLYPVSLI